MLGSCTCKNLHINWQIKDFSLTPRACQCAYCKSKNAAWVAKPGSKFTLIINRVNEYRAHTQGLRSAAFHECLFCGELVAVTCGIDGTTYGLINVHTLRKSERFPEIRNTEFIEQSLDERIKHRSLNWSSPVEVIFQNNKPTLKVVH